MVLKTKPVTPPIPLSVECRDMRGPACKTFRLPTGEMRCEAYQRDTHYTSDEGELRTIDTTIQQDAGRVFVEWAPYKFQLLKDAIGFTFLSRAGGSVRLSLESIGGKPPEIKEPSIQDNRITFSDASAGVHIVFICLPERVKTLRVIQGDTAAREFVWRCETDDAGSDKINDELIGFDAAGLRLDLQSTVRAIGKNQQEITESWSGLVKVKDPATRMMSLSEEATYPVVIDPTVTYKVGATARDGSQLSQDSNPTTFANWYPTIVYFGHNAAVFGYHPGWTMPAVSVPQGATITSATLTIKSINGNASTGTLWGEAADNATAWANAHKPLSVTKTASSKSVTVTPNAVNVFDVSGPVQDIINRAGWASGNRMNLFGVGSGAVVGFLQDYGTNTADSGTLSITYSLGGGSKSLMLLGVG